MVDNYFTEIRTKPTAPDRESVERAIRGLAHDAEMRRAGDEKALEAIRTFDFVLASAAVTEWVYAAHSDIAEAISDGGGFHEYTRGNGKTYVCTMERAAEEPRYWIEAEYAFEDVCEWFDIPHDDKAIEVVEEALRFAVKERREQLDGPPLAKYFVEWVE